MHVSKLLVRLILSTALLVSLVCALSIAIRGDLLFHTDIARDHLLIEDMLLKQRPALIGPRAGGIPGVFHGPLWLYINIPFFLLGDGDPKAIGMGWFVMWVTLLTLLWLVAKKILNDTNGALAVTTFFALLSFSRITNYLNPAGAMLVVPAWFLGVVMYYREHKVRYLMLAYFVIGIIIQFQMALGVPLFLLTFLGTLWIVFQKKNWRHLIAVFATAPFLITFIVFDIRHDFLQLKSVLNYLLGDVSFGKTSLTFGPLLLERFYLARIKLEEMLSSGVLSTDVIVAIVSLCFGYVLAKTTMRHGSWRKSVPDFVGLFTLFWIGYWVITLLYKGVMWGYYFEPILPVAALTFIGLIITTFPKYGLLFVALFCALMTPFHWLPSIVSSVNQTTSVKGEWATMKDIYEKNMFSSKLPKDFGYFVFTRDRLGYSQSYAMHYLAKLHPDFDIHPFEKRKTTYLLVETEYSPVVNREYWKKYQVKIISAPKEVTKLTGSFVIERYELTDDEMKIPANTDLSTDIFYR